MCRFVSWNNAATLNRWSGSDVRGRETQFCELERREGRCGRLGRVRMRGTVSRNDARGAAGGLDVRGCAAR